MYWEEKGGGREGKGCVGRSARGGPIQLKSERFCGKGAKSAARRARPARPPEQGVRGVTPCEGEREEELIREVLVQKGCVYPRERIVLPLCKKQAFLWKSTNSAVGCGLGWGCGIPSAHLHTPSRACARAR